MAIVAGDTVIPAGIFNRSSGGSADLAKGTLCPDGISIGTYLGTSADSTWTNWNSGEQDNDGGYNAANLRKCTEYSGEDLLGKTVSLLNVAPAFRGTVVQQFDTELDDVEGNGTQVPVCVIKTERFYYVAEPGDLQEVF